MIERDQRLAVADGHELDATEPADAGTGRTSITARRP